MPTPPIIISLATAWGAKHGGINVFNVDLMRAMGTQPWRNYELLCMVLHATDEDRHDAEQCHVKLLDLGDAGKDFADDAAETIASKFGQRFHNRTCIWLGHDIHSGGLALQLRDIVANSQAALIHHMAFSAYQDFKKGDGQEAAAKRETQRNMFKQADLCFAVGPMLRDQLNDLLGAIPNPPAIEMLVPGLAEQDPDKVRIRAQAPNNFMAFVAGRLGADDERIKQGELAVRGFGIAVKSAFQDGNEAHAIRRSPTLRMRGVPQTGHEAVKQVLRDACGRELNCDLREYTEDRTDYFDALASSSVALMPSWHEGFGLTAWEAIACQVPVIIGEQSGVYRLLHDECQGMGLNTEWSVHSVAIDGQCGSDTEPNHSERDVEAVADAIFTLGGNIEKAKHNAVKLLGNLRNIGYRWECCADTLATAIQKHLGCELKIDTKILAAESMPKHMATRDAIPAALNIPAFLRPPTVRPWRVEDKLPPSVLLTARDQIARFRPERDKVVNELLEWANTETARIGLRVLCGPGGMGKTRTALEILKRADDWQRLWLANELPADWQAQWSSWLESNDGKNVWLVIDYADTRQDTLLHLLKHALEFSRSGRRSAALRILMLTRHPAWWSELTRHPDCTNEVADLLAGSANSGVVELPAWQDDRVSREETYRAALEDYAAAQGRSVSRYVYVPELTAPVFDRPLYIHLAALAALEGERPSHANSLLQSQLRREWSFWMRQHGAELACYDDWADVLAWLGLVQGASVVQAQAAILQLGIDASALVKAYADSYRGDKGTIAMLQPDLLVEALLRERLAGERGQCLLEAALPVDDAAMAVASLSVLARFAAELPDDETSVREAMQNGLVCALPYHGQILVNTAHEAGSKFAGLLLEAWHLLPNDLQVTAITGLALPDYSTPLLQFSVTIERTRLRAASSDAEMAQVMNNLGSRLSALGDAASRTEALECARETLKIYRELVETQRAAYLPLLAGALNNLANRLVEQGDAASRTEALVCAHEAVMIYRELVATQRAAYLPALAGALNNLANHLSGQGDAASRTEALACAREAVTIRRELVETQRAAYLPDLAASLNNLAIRLAEQGDAASRTEALECAREAVNIHRELVETQRAAYLHVLAGALNSLANRLSERGDSASRTEALECAREAVTIRRELVETQRAAYLPDLAASLNTLASRLSERGDSASCTEALECAREAVRIYRELVETQRAAYLPALAGTLNNLSNRLSEQDYADFRTEALECAREAVKIRRELVETQRAAYLPALAASLNNLANRLAKQGDAASCTEALVFAREAVRICRELVEIQRAAYLPVLAGSLNNLANRLAEQGDGASCTEALVFAREAVKIRRELVETQRAAYLPDLAASLYNLAISLSEQGDAASRTEALVCAREAVKVFAWLDANIASVFERNLKVSIEALSFVALSHGLDEKEEIEKAVSSGRLFEPQDDSATPDDSGET